ncbi:MAG: glycerol kinase [Halobacteriovorax sp.]|nr:glycerol kinase [Halobacteriovorax sp.]
MGYILSIDQGTTGTTAVLVDDSNFNFVDKVNQEFPQIFPSPGLVEHNLNDIWGTVEKTITEVLNRNKLDGKSISSIGITNQRETICAFNKNGEQLHNAIVWQDRRTGEFCANLIKMGHQDSIKEKTGLPIDPYFSGTKINWLLNNSEKVKEAQASKDLKFGNIDTYLLYKLTSGDSYFTEPSNASRTMLFNLSSNTWDNELCEIMGVKEDSLPKVKDSFSNFGLTRGLGFLPDGIPITGILGDQQAALFGQAGFKEGDLKCTYGTGAFILLNTGESPSYSKNGLITTIAYRNEGKTFYALEGSSYIAGAAVQWLRDQLDFFPDSPEVENLATKITNLEEMEHVLFLPFFTGLGSPHWVTEAKASIIGLTRDTNKNHISLACLDGIALSIEDLIRSLKSDSGLSIKSLKVDGGAVANDLLMKIQATVSDLEIIKPQIIETTAYGACLASAIGNKTIGFDQIASLWKKDKSIDPDKTSAEHYKKKKTQWNRAIERLYL